VYENASLTSVWAYLAMVGRPVRWGIFACHEDCVLAHSCPAPSAKASEVKTTVDAKVEGLVDVEGK
jgi:hypothetical protein